MRAIGMLAASALLVALCLAFCFVWVCLLLALHWVMEKRFARTHRFPRSGALPARKRNTEPASARPFIPPPRVGVDRPRARVTVRYPPRARTTAGNPPRNDEMTYLWQRRPPPFQLSNVPETCGGSTFLQAPIRITQTIFTDPVWIPCKGCAECAPILADTSSRESTDGRL